MRKETLVDLLRDSVNTHSEWTAVKQQIPGRAESTEGWTYRELGDRVNSVANHLSEYIGNGDRVLIAMKNHPEFLCGDFGVLSTGGISVPISVRKTEDMFDRYVEFVEPSAIISRGSYYKIAKDNVRGIPIFDIDEMMDGDFSSSNIDIDPQDTSTLIFSSGTTSVHGDRLKAVELSHSNLVSNIQATSFLGDRVRAEENIEQIVCLAGLADHAHAFTYMADKSNIFNGDLLHFTNHNDVEAGYAAHIGANCGLMVPKVMNDIIKDIREGVREKRGWLGLQLFNYVLSKSVELRYDQVNNNSNPKEKSWRSLLNYIGEKCFYPKVRKGLEEKFGKNDLYFMGGSARPDKNNHVAFNIFYSLDWGFGASEASPVISSTISNKNVNKGKYFEYGSSGKVIPDVNVVIADPGDLKKGLITEVDNGEPGVILFNGPNLFKGYYNDPESTAKVIIEDGGKRWYNTGDLGYFVGKMLYVDGREDSQIKLPKGVKLCPEKVEEHYAGVGLEMVLVDDGYGNTGALIISENGQSRKKVINNAVRTLSDSNDLFRITLGRSRLEVISDFNRGKYETGVKKKKRKLICNDYKDLIKKVTR